jgi:uridine phosphorylase
MVRSASAGHRIEAGLHCEYDPHTGAVMDYPITEFDSDEQAFIEPSMTTRPRDVAEYCVPCFFLEVIEKVAADHNARVVVANRWEDGLHRLYEIDYEGGKLAFYHPGIGSAMSAALLEEVIAFGCRKFVACGGCGVLNTDLGLGQLLCVSAAVRDEGASYHYLPPAREVAAAPAALTTISETLDRRGIPFVVGKTWTTSAPYRETRARIARRRSEGCLVVEMEAAGMLAVAEFRGVPFGQILYGGDDLTGNAWDNRNWQNRRQVRENLFWLCAEAVLAL